MTLRAFVCLSLLFLAQHTALLAEPVAGDEHPLTEPVVSPAGCGQSSGVAASDGQNVAIVWAHRCELGQSYVLVSRFDCDGRPLDAAPHVLGEVSTSEDPWIAWTGSRYLVVWSTLTSIRGRVLSPDGEVGPDVAILTGEALARPRIAVSSGRVLVAAVIVRNEGASTAIRAAILDESANPLVPPVDLGNFNQHGYAIEGSANGFLLVGSHSGVPYAEEQSLEALPIGLDGSQGTQRQISPHERYVDPSLAFDGHGFVAAWSSAGVTKSARLDPDGNASSPRVILSGFVHVGPPTSRVITWAGHYFVVLLADRYKVWSLPLDAEGSVAGPLTEIIPPNAGAFGATSAVRTEDGVLCVTQTGGYSYGSDMYGVQLDDQGRVVSERPFWLATSPARQVEPDAARANGRQLIAWKEERPLEGHWVVAAIILDDAGTVSGPFVLGETSYDAFVRVASDGESFVVAWWAFADEFFRVARLESDGGSPAVRTIRGTLLTEDLRIGWTGENYVVVSLQWAASPSTCNALSGIRLDRNGEPIDEEPFTIATGLQGILGGLGGALSLEGSEGRVTALFGGTPLMQVVVPSAGVPESPVATPFAAFDVVQTEGLAAWLPIDTPDPGTSPSAPPARIEWGRVVDTGVSVISSVSRGGLTPYTKLTIARFGAGYLLVWDEGTTPHRSLHALQLDGSGNPVSLPQRLHSDLDDSGAPVLTGTAGRTDLVYEATDARFATPELSRVYARSLAEGEPIRHRGVRR